MGANINSTNRSKKTGQQVRKGKKPQKEMVENTYTEDQIKTLDWREHIRLRPGMYIGKLGDGSSADDGIYVLLKEVIDNCIDELRHGFWQAYRHRYQ
ncbi:MAG: hypothetical protein R2778_06245 [Saprospiraceae bacterium]